MNLPHQTRTQKAQGKRIISDDSVPKSLIHIVGPNKLQNELLIPFLEVETGMKCACSLTLNLASIIDKKPAQKHLILLDGMGIDFDRFWTEHVVDSNLILFQYNIAIFNVDPGKGFEREALNQGVRGIIYNNEPLEIFPKCITAVLNGQLWYPMGTLSECILEEKSRAKSSEEASSVLTAREKEILIRIASGASNKDIANDLCISLHTVKTHIYNIYKKINIPNRHQATLWAARYLSTRA